jgi:hypothetical protein
MGLHALVCVPAAFTTYLGLRQHARTSTTSTLLRSKWMLLDSIGVCCMAGLRLWHGCKGLVLCSYWRLFVSWEASRLCIFVERAVYAPPVQCHCQARGFAFPCRIDLQIKIARSTNRWAVVCVGYVFCMCRTAVRVSQWCYVQAA